MEQQAQGSQAAPRPLMASLMAQNGCWTWLTTVINTGQPNTAVAGSQHTLVLEISMFIAGGPILWKVTLTRRGITSLSLICGKSWDSQVIKTDWDMRASWYSNQLLASNFFPFSEIEWMPHISLSFDSNNICLGALKSEEKCHSNGVHKYIQWQTNINYRYIRKS